ncbi:MAG TPA: head maturation protease, ClpP-related [Microvirga sp.]|jgi:ATP-dependent protease ClpP protease subunit|nr:head maturation protease, ClpP-related [Microvirga sp.]
MTLRKLPKIQAFERPADDLTPVPADAVLSRWKPGVHAATSTDNSISIYDVIGEDFWTGEGVTSKRIAAALRSIGDNDVVVNVNSPGGDFFEGIAIYNLLREHPRKVTVRVMGLAASAASIIAMAGDEILISEIGFVMVHNAWAVAVGNRHDMREAADTLEPFDDAMAGLYATRAGVEKAEAQSWMDKETWFNGSQAIENGLANGLLPSSEVEQSDDKGAKALAAARRIEAALSRQGLPRSERRSLIGEVAGLPAVAAAETRPAVADDDLSPAALKQLISVFRP